MIADEAQDLRDNLNLKSPCPPFFKGDEEGFYGNALKDSLRF